MRILVAAFIAVVMTAGGASAQADSVSVAPGARYASGSALHELLFGSRYRELWTMPIRVPVLDIGKFAGGLTPVRTGGSLQTVSLRFEGADGREYNFRSVDKELTPAMHPFAQETVLDWIRQDQTSAQLPTAPIIATSLLDAAGILNPGPRLMVMPDDPRLGEFRDQFAGMLGTMEVHADEGDADRRLFADAEAVASTDRLLEHLEEDLDHRVDSRAFLKARLMDVYLGDYDRHGDQWRWARYERDGLQWWVPVPEDRDYAFVAYDGLLLDVGRRVGVKRLIVFDDDYPDLVQMVDNSLAFTRYLVSDLTWNDWREVVAELEGSLTDDVIERAVGTMPPSHFELYGEKLIQDLRARRDGLRPMAWRFYRLLSHVVEIHGTDADDRLEIDRLADGTTEVRLYAAGDEPPRYRRVLDPEITREVRVFLEGGDDQALVRGTTREIEVHVIGGGGDDTFVDASAGPTGFYDDRGENRFTRGPGTYVDERPWTEPPMMPPEDAGDAEEPGAGGGDEGAADEEPEPSAPPDGRRPTNGDAPGGESRETRDGRNPGVDALNVSATSSPLGEGSRLVAGALSRGADARAQASQGAAEAPGATLPQVDAEVGDSFGGVEVGGTDAPAGADQPAPSTNQEPDGLLPGLERDWGQEFTFSSVTVGWEGHAELVLGIGPRLTDFGYRYSPYEARYWARALYAPLASHGGIDFGADLRRIRSSRHLVIHGRVSNLDATVTNGFGNDSPAEDRVLIWHVRGYVDAALHVIDTPRYGVSFGPSVEYIDPRSEPAATLPFPTAHLESSTRFGGRLRAWLDTRDNTVFARRGFRLALDAHGFPGRDRNVAGAELAGTAVLPLPVGAISLRGGVRGVFGDYVFYDAVSIGGSETLRGYRLQRLAGDRAAFAGSTVHLPIAPMKLLVRGTLGASLFADAGRVWFEGQSPGGWHTGAGGGVWFQVPIGAVSFSYARGEEDRFYFRFGLPY